MKKPKVLFFARDYQSIFFPYLKSEYYESFYVTLTVFEKDNLINNGCKVVACFQEDFDNLNDYKDFELEELRTSFFSDRYYGKFDITQRNYILNKEMSFWNRIFMSNNYDFVINEVIAFEHSEVMYIKAEEFNVKYLAWMVSPFQDKNFYWLSSPFHASLDDEIFKTIPSKSSITHAKEYFENFINSDKNKPFYIQNLVKRFAHYNNLKLIIKYFFALLLFGLKKGKSNTFFQKSYNSYESYVQKIQLIINSYFFRYDNIENVKKFELVFYPLHFEPEASIIYFSEFHEDQPALIRNISKCLKRNQVLVIKEHPQQSGMLLTKRFRDLKRRISNIIYLPSEFPTKQLIISSKLIITQTSTAGWEALILGKPVVVLGKVFYDKFININPFLDFNSLRESIHNEAYQYPEKDNLIDFIAKMWEYCNYGNPYPHKNLYSKENTNRIIDAIVSKISNFK